MLASMENLVRVARSAESQNFFTESLPQIHREMGAALRETHPQLSQEQAEAVAQLYFVLVQGLGILWTIVPTAELPDGDRLTEAIAAIHASAPLPFPE
jgi:hypothetical protein